MLFHVALTVPLSLSLALPRTPDRLDSLRASIERRVGEVAGATAGVAFRDLGNGDSVMLRPDEGFHAASTMKVPVMIELFRQIDRRMMLLDQGILLVNRFASIVDGSPYSLDPADDSDTLMYRSIGTRVPVRDLIEHMITR